MVPSKIKIESFAKRCHMGTLGGKGLNKKASVSIFFICNQCKKFNVIALTKKNIKHSITYEIKLNYCIYIISICQIL